MRVVEQTGVDEPFDEDEDMLGEDIAGNEPEPVTAAIPILDVDELEALDPDDGNPAPSDGGGGTDDTEDPTIDKQDDQDNHDREEQRDAQ